MKKLYYVRREEIVNITGLNVPSLALVNGLYFKLVGSKI
jgi:hypothetical protein